ncbi:hypothetical protein HYD57_02330 [Mycoplasmopsis bovis]|nr:hypothetical protein [Mycoplasmopsis bovis]QQH66226.1 hypothetical protein HYD57_02330 [Mycoplasmopsis bovis]
MVLVILLQDTTPQTKDNQNLPKNDNIKWKRYKVMTLVVLVILSPNTTPQILR